MKKWKMLRVNKNEIHDVGRIKFYRSDDLDSCVAEIVIENGFGHTYEDCGTYGGTYGYYPRLYNESQDTLNCMAEQMQGTYQEGR